MKIEKVTIGFAMQINDGWMHEDFYVWSLNRDRIFSPYNYRLLLGKLALYVNGWRDIANRERVNEAMLERRPCWPI